MRAMLVALFLSLPFLCYASQANSNANLSVDKVLVVKSERALHLMHRGEIIKSYRVSLGKKTGPKEYEGDQRTPEGLYWINWRKKSDNFSQCRAMRRCKVSNPMFTKKAFWGD